MFLQWVLDGGVSVSPNEGDNVSASPKGVLRYGGSGWVSPNEGGEGVGCAGVSVAVSIQVY